MKTIVFANQKGGTGKTTTVINTGDALARAGKRVLLVDFDPQGHAAVSLNLDPEGSVANWLLHSVFNASPLSAADLNQWVRKTHHENLYVLPGSQMTAKVQRLLAMEEKPVNYIRECLPPLRQLGFDFLLFDTSPSTGGLQEMASWAADLAVIVSSLDYLSADGVSGFLEMLKVLQTEKQWRGKLAGVLPTFYDKQTRTTREQMTNLQSAFPDQVFTPIHRATLIREASAEGLTIFQKDPTSRPAREYEKFAAQLAKLSLEDMMSGRNAFGTLTTTSTVAHDLKVAQVHKRTRAWEKSNPARRYLIPIEVRNDVAALAEALMENVDPVAGVLFDYAETCHTRGTLKFKPRLNPKGRKHTLAWEEADTEPIQLPTRRPRKTKPADTLLSRSLKGQTAAYRLGAERHEKLKAIAEAYNLRLADVLAAFFRYSLDAYQAGKLKIRREPVVMQMQVKGWSG